MTILVTGGLGFIGRTLIEELIKENHEVVVIDRNEYSGSRYIHSSLIKYVIGDYGDMPLLEEIYRFHNFDGVIHLAAISRVIEAENNQQECVRTNVTSIVSLLTALKLSGQVPWLIFGSSREVYGESKVFPVTESAEKLPMNIYGKSKLQGELLFREYAEQQGLSCGILRFSNVYGNRFDIGDRVLPRFIRAIALGDQLCIEGGGQIIDFTHIDDTVRGIIRTIYYLTELGGIEDFHLLPGVGWTLYEAIEIIENILGKKAVIQVNTKRNYDVEKFIGDPSKARRLLRLGDFKGLQQGLKASVSEYSGVLI